MAGGGPTVGKVITRVVSIITSAERSGGNFNDPLRGVHLGAGVPRRFVSRRRCYYMNNTAVCSRLVTDTNNFNARRSLDGVDGVFVIIIYLIILLIPLLL